MWGVDYDSSIDKSNGIRSSTGVGMNLLTPVGPLSFSLTHPISKQDTDKTESFRFNLELLFNGQKIITLLGIIFIFSTNYLYATEKIAFIDLNYIYVNSKVGKKIIDETQKKQKIIEKNLKIFKKIR